MSETLDPVAMELDQRQLAEQLLASSFDSQILKKRQRRPG